MSNDKLPAVRRSREPSVRPIVLETLPDYLAFAELVARSGWAPKGMDVPAIVVALEFGAELGLGPLTALQNIAVVNGRPCVWGDAALALCKRHPAWDEAAFREDLILDENGQLVGAQCTVRRIPADSITRTFTVEDAKRARLWGREGCWSQYPARMLQMRARSWALRDAFPDVLKGIGIREEWEGVDETSSQPPADTSPAEDDTCRVQRLVERIRGNDKPAAQETEQLF